mmetsp:Transcript_7959/g.11894  ORF Transcript_7959/g.11894 Transcript_7959/m.11894 type:complete len:291 (-) Transcript_7959:28-900(-)
MIVADERRRWQVLYYTKGGKPDKKRRPGRPWDPSVFAGPEKAVYSVGPQGVDLFALDAQGPSGGSSGATKQLDKISLQAYLEQVSCYEQLLKPITDIMQRSLSHSNAPASNNQSKSEEAVRARKKAARRLKMFPGAMGAELETALVNIGAVEPAIDSDRPKRFTLGPLMSTNSPKQIENNQEIQRTNLLPSLTNRPPQLDDINRDITIGRLKRGNSVRKETLRSMTLEPIEVVIDPATDRLRRKRLEDKKLRKKANRKSAVIPWDLLDSLDGEKRRFEKEKLFVEFHKKF